jgi:hypothetical protein
MDFLVCNTETACTDLIAMPCRRNYDSIIDEPRNSVSYIDYVVMVIHGLGHSWMNIF